MLVLSRKPQETIVLEGAVDGVINGGITITVVEVRGNQVRLGIEAPQQVAIRRGELRLDTIAGPRDRSNPAQIAQRGETKADGPCEHRLAAKESEVACAW